MVVGVVRNGMKFNSERAREREEEGGMCDKGEWWEGDECGGRRQGRVEGG